MLRDLSVPLRDALNYVAYTNDSDAYTKLIYAQEQLNGSIRELENVVSDIL